MGGRSFDVCEFLGQACWCPCCRVRVMWLMAPRSRLGAGAIATCVRCGVSMRFTVVPSPWSPWPPVNAKSVMVDWAALVERPELRPEGCACR